MGGVAEFVRLVFLVQTWRAWTTNCIFPPLSEKTGVVIFIFSLVSFFPNKYPASVLKAVPPPWPAGVLPLVEDMLVSATTNGSYLQMQLHI